MDKALLTIRTALDFAAWLLLALALAATVGGCPWARFAWAVCVGVAVMAMRHGLMAAVLAKAKESSAMVADAQAALMLNGLAKEAKPEGPQTVEELVKAAMVGKGGAD